MEDEDLLPISALEHLLYCPRQCALIHVDGVWVENAHTVAGKLLHERVDEPDEERRPGVVVVRAALLRCVRLGLRGVADAVEFYPERGGGWRPYPIEYKRGARRKHAHDEVQLCAQALALEEMMGVAVPEGAIFHAKSQRRRVVRIDADLRARTEDAARRLRAMVTAREVPAPVCDERCEECSLRPACQPEVTARAMSLEEALREALR